MNELDEMNRAMVQMSRFVGSYGIHSEDLRHIHIQRIETVKERNKRVLEDREILMKQVIRKQKGR
jgi:hypothetical protein